MNDDNRTNPRTSRLVGWATMVLLATAPSVAPAQSMAVTAQESPARTFSAAPVAWTASAVNNQLPQDIRIMQRIVSTALGEVEAPELPAELRTERATPEPAPSTPEPASSTPEPVPSTPEPEYGWAVRMAPRFGVRGYIGGREISGFYMQGYGYLFTVTWRVSGALGSDDLLQVRAAEMALLAERAAIASTSSEETEARAADRARRTLDAERQEAERQRDAWRDWSAEYRARLAQELAGVLAQYGSTLNRAAPDESITFIADFGGGESETVTATARRGDLSGVGRDENLGAVRLARGEATVSEGLETELKIMSAIIDSSLEEPARSGETMAVYSARAWTLGGPSGFQYVPGYGVLFRKSARLNLATRVIQSVAPEVLDASGNSVAVGSLRDRINESTAEQRETYAEHLESLKESTAAVLATYGPTLTQLEPGEWVGVYYDVGSAASLLQGGISNFLVQARIDDIRAAAAEADPAAYLRERLVTNERQD